MLGFGQPRLHVGDRIEVLGSHRRAQHQHQDDQAETVLLQLLRGAGPPGLAAMPVARTDARGVTWLRPFLDVPRAAIDAYVRERDLAWVDDDSNADARYLRNAMREGVVPALNAMAVGYPATIARAAALHRRQRKGRRRIETAYGFSSRRDTSRPAACQARIFRSARSPRGRSAAREACDRSWPRGCRTRVVCRGRHRHPRWP